MITIQEVGSEILTNNPKSFYVMIGSEYGIKAKYIDVLKSHYSGRLVEAESVSAVLNMMRTKRIIPLEPALYVVRYDESFLATLSDSTKRDIANTNIRGTIVCIYESGKQVSKLDKYLPDHTVSVDAVSSQFVNKYLHSDFPKLNDRFINIAVNSAANYGQARLMCKCMELVPVESLYRLSDSEISKLFGILDVSTELQLKRGIASRNFAYLLDLLSRYEGEIDSIFYTILSTMIELDKIQDSNYTQSDLKEFSKRWSREDIYYMFMHTYRELERIRSLSVSDTESVVVYLFALLTYSRIPSVEVMSE